MPEGPFKKLGREVRSMDSSIVTALSAILGSLVGGSASIATAWITQKTQSRRELVITERTPSMLSLSQSSNHMGQISPGLTSPKDESLFA